MHDFIEKSKKHQGELSTILILDSGIPENKELREKINLNKSFNFYSLPFFEKHCKNKNYLFKDKKYKYEFELEVDYFDHQTNIMSVISSDYLGISPKSKIISGKILNKHGMAPLEYILEGLIYANRLNPDIVNISNGYSLNDIKRSKDYMIHDLINEEIIKLYKKNIIVVCAKKNWDTGFYPADFEETISVLEIDELKENIADFTYEKLKFIVDSGKNSFDIKSGSSLMTGFISGVISNYVTYLKYNDKEIDVFKIKKELIKNKEKLKKIYPPSIKLTSMSEKKIYQIINNFKEIENNY